MGPSLPKLQRRTRDRQWEPVGDSAVPARLLPSSPFCKPCVPPLFLGPSSLPWEARPDQRGALPCFLPWVLCQSHGVILHPPVTPQHLTHLPASSPAIPPTTTTPPYRHSRHSDSQAQFPNPPPSLRHGLDFPFAWRTPPWLSEPGKSL